MRRACRLNPHVGERSRLPPQPWPSCRRGAWHPIRGQRERHDGARVARDGVPELILVEHHHWRQIDAGGRDGGLGREHSFGHGRCAHVERRAPLREVPGSGDDERVPDPRLIDRQPRERRDALLGHDGRRAVEQTGRAGGKRDSGGRVSGLHVAGLVLERDNDGSENDPPAAMLVEQVLKTALLAGPTTKDTVVETVLSWPPTVAVTVSVWATVEDSVAVSWPFTESFPPVVENVLPLPLADSVTAAPASRVSTWRRAR